MITFFKRILTIYFLALSGSTLAQQKQLTIEDCYVLAKQNYPLIKKQALITKSSDYSLDNAAKGFLPQIILSGQTTYQSETIHFPDALAGAGISLPNISKGQYKIQTDVSQQIFDGGVSKNKSK